MAARVSMLLKSCASLKCFRALSFLVGLRTYQHSGNIRPARSPLPNRRLWRTTCASQRKLFSGVSNIMVGPLMCIPVYRLSTWEFFLFCYYSQNKILHSPDLHKFPLEDSLQHIHTGNQSYLFQNLTHVFISLPLPSPLPTEN